LARQPHHRDENNQQRKSREPKNDRASFANKIAPRVPARGMIEPGQPNVTLSKQGDIISLFDCKRIYDGMSGFFSFFLLPLDY
jgi:hypothetical protein